MLQLTHRLARFHTLQRRFLQRLWWYSPVLRHPTPRSHTPGTPRASLLGAPAPGSSHGTTPTLPRGCFFVGCDQGMLKGVLREGTSSSPQPHGVTSPLATRQGARCTKPRSLGNEAGLGRDRTHQCPPGRSHRQGLQSAPSTSPWAFPACQCLHWHLKHHSPDCALSSLPLLPAEVLASLFDIRLRLGTGQPARRQPGDISPSWCCYIHCCGAGSYSLHILSLLLLFLVAFFFVCFKM